MEIRIPDGELEMEIGPVTVEPKSCTVVMFEAESYPTYPHFLTSKMWRHTSQRYIYGFQTSYESKYFIFTVQYIYIYFKLRKQLDDWMTHSPGNV